MASNFNPQPILFSYPATNSQAGVLQLAGDFGGTYLAPLVLKLNGIALPTGTPTSGQTILYNGTSFVYGVPGAAVVAKREITVSYATTLTPNAATTDIFRVTLTGNATIANPTGTPVAGQILQVELTQDSAGSRTVTWGASYVFSTGIPTPTLTTTANKSDLVLFQWSAAASAWRCVGFVPGF